VDTQVTLRPVTEDDLPWLDRLGNDPATTGPHEWHGWIIYSVLRDEVKLSDPATEQARAEGSWC